MRYNVIMKQEEDAPDFNMDPAGLWREEAFTDRKVGSSKISRRIVWEAFFIVWRLKFSPKHESVKPCAVS